MEEEGGLQDGLDLQDHLELQMDLAVEDCDPFLNITTDDNISLQPPSTSTSSSNKKRRLPVPVTDQSDEKMELLKKLCSRYEQPLAKPDNLDKFFASICDTVRQFPKEEIAKLKLHISQVVGEVEVRLAQEEGRRVMTGEESYNIVLMNEENL